MKNAFKALLEIPVVPVTKSLTFLKMKLVKETTY